MAKKRHPLKGLKLKVMQLWWAGKSYHEIKDALNLPYDTVYGIVNRYRDVPNPDESKTDKKPTILVIGDTQAKQGIDLSYLDWVGAYIAYKKPDVIVHIGDHYDMASLSSYDKHQLSAEGRRFLADIEAGDDGLARIEAHISRVPDYNPRKVVTLGNHEDRIDRFVQFNPEFEGYIGTDKLAFVEYGWEVYPFLTPAMIEGINFIHYVPNPMSGKPYGGSVMNRLMKTGESFVMGHQQVLDHCQRHTLSGRGQIGVVVGACYAHQESYKGVTGNHHFRGCVMIYECKDGYGLVKPVSLDHMKTLYEKGISTS